MQTEQIANLELLLGHHFRDKAYIENALSHSSIKTNDRPSNERLEFLGDSVLGLVVADALYRRFPDDEGTLTRIKSQAVSRATLQRVALAMGLDRYILVGKGVAKREIPASLLGNLFEAIVGAIYLDAGFEASGKFVMRNLDIVIDEIVDDRAERNYKSMLQHYCQRDLGAVPTYRVVRESGPAHTRAFEVAMAVNGKEYGRAKARSKKEAEQGAARAALIHFDQVEERASDAATRGAGTILHVGGKDPGKPKRRRRGARKASRPPATGAEAPSSPAPDKPKGGTRRRRGTRKDSHPPATGAEAPSSPAPDKPKGGTRRRRGSRGGRRRKQAADAQKADTPAEAQPQAAAPALGKKRAPRRKKFVARKRAAGNAVVKKTATKKKRVRRKKKTGGE